MKGIEQAATEKGYNIMVCFSNDKEKKEAETISVLTNGSVDGLLVSIAKETFEKGEFTHFKNLIQNNVPLVLFDRTHHSLACDKVTVGDVGAGYKATKYLLNTGCKRIGILTTPKHINVGTERLQGYEKALLEFGHTIKESYIIRVREEADIRTQIEKLFLQDIDAVFAVNEIYAAVAIRIAKEKNMQIPEELSVIGFTDGLISEYSSPSISTVVQHGFTMGKQAAEMLIQQIETNNPNKKPQTKVISSDLKIRESSKS
ncbi:substrate-binding domain-containing protein [Tenacibaculum sp. SG-28]|uniref:substrate-binding domain-containing protein n=1 Tax=Tenacibaculum sp. SG-28 TaxID=754426 RepID=UPI003514F716